MKRIHLPCITSTLGFWANAADVIAHCQPLDIPDCFDIVYPNDEPFSLNLVDLGRVLSFDPRLIADEFDNQVACSKYYIPDLTFTGSWPFSDLSRKHPFARLSPAPGIAKEP